MREGGHEAPGYPPAGLGPRAGRSGTTSAGAPGSSPRSIATSRSSAAIRRRHLLQRVGDRVGQVDPVGVRALGLAALDAHRMAGVADHGRVRRHLVDDDRVGADLRAVADRDRAEQLRAGADRHVVLHRRVALAGLEAGAAERDALVHRHVGADLGRLADHDAHPVVDEQPVADPRRAGGSRSRSARARRRRARAGRAGRRRRRARARRGGRAARAGRASRSRISSVETPVGGGVALAHGGDVAAQLAGDPADRAQTQHPSEGYPRSPGSRGAAHVDARGLQRGEVDAAGTRPRAAAARRSGTSAPRAPAASRSRPPPGPAIARLGARRRVLGLDRERAAVARGAPGHDRHHEAAPAHRAALDEVDPAVAAGGVDGVAGGEGVASSRSPGPGPRSARRRWSSSTRTW